MRSQKLRILGIVGPPCPPWLDGFIKDGLVDKAWEGPDGRKSGEQRR